MLLGDRPGDRHSLFFRHQGGLFRFEILIGFFEGLLLVFFAGGPFGLFSSPPSHFPHTLDKTDEPHKSQAGATLPYPRIDWMRVGQGHDQDIHADESKDQGRYEKNGGENQAFPPGRRPFIAGVALLADPDRAAKAFPSFRQGTTALGANRTDRIRFHGSYLKVGFVTDSFRVPRWIDSAGCPGAHPCAGTFGSGPPADRREGRCAVRAGNGAGSSLEYWPSPDDLDGHRRAVRE